MPDADDSRLNQTKFFVLYSRLASTQLGTLVNTYSYNDVKRMIRVDDNEIDPDGDDPLSEIIVEGIKELPHTEVDGKAELSIDPPASMAALFQDHPIARSLKPKLWVALDLLDEDTPVCGMLTACTFERDAALSTSKLTQPYCTQHELPRLDSNWLLVDVVASSKSKTGALLLLQAVISAMRAKKSGVCSIAVTKAGRRLFTAFGFQTDHSWKEKGGQRFLCYARVADIHLADLHTRIRVHDALLTDVCFRNGLTPKTAQSLIGRC